MDGDNDSETSYLNDEEVFIRKLQGIKDNEEWSDGLEGWGNSTFILNISNEQWEEIGRDISNNSYLKKFDFDHGALNDDKVSYLFRGLTKSSSLEELDLECNEISAAGVRSMVPFLQNATNLRELSLDGNNIQSEGFNMLLRALRDSPIEQLGCMECDIESIEIDTDYFPRYLKDLALTGNHINADGCREIAKLLQRGDSVLKTLFLGNNKIDDEGVASLVGALRRNESLKCLFLAGNSGISNEGHLLLLKLVNDISSVKATLQSNHTLRRIDVSKDLDQVSQQQINMATNINEYCHNPEAAGREKMIQTQLHSGKRAELATAQGVSHSVYSEINPLHLPEVLALVGRRHRQIGRRHGQGELFDALKSSIARLISTVNRKQFIKQQLEYHLRKVDELHAALADIEAAEVDIVASIHDSRQSKRLRV